jgi:hypothetical protein
MDLSDFALLINTKTHANYKESCMLLQKRLIFRIIILQGLSWKKNYPKICHS